MAYATTATLTALNGLRAPRQSGLGDALVQAINDGRLHAGNITANAIRQLGGRDNGLWAQLDRGRRILCGQHELQQYLRSYAPMVGRQWEAFYALSPAYPLRDVSSTERFHVIDHGCGQALGTAHLFDNLRESRLLPRDVASVTLIEPSADALRRAHHIVQAYVPDLPVVCLNQTINAVDLAQMPAAGGNYLHLFSNVLDVPGFDALKMFGWMLETRGTHTVLAVSNDRDRNGGSAQMINLQGHLQALRHAGITVHVNQLHRYHVTMSSGSSPVIAWQLQLEVA